MTGSNVGMTKGETRRRMTKGRMAQVVQGMALCRASEYDDSMRLPVEVLKNGDIIVRLRLTGTSAETYQAIRTALKGGTPWFVLDRSGAVVNLYKNALNGRGIEKLSMARILETLPDTDELPEDFKWTDFTKQQLTALMLMSDITSSLTREQIGATCGVDKVTLWRWEGKGKFLKAKAWLLERARHRLEEDFYRNVGTGQYSADDAVKFQYTKLVGEACGKIGRRAGDDQGPAKNESELASSLAALAPSTRAALGAEFRVMANLLSGEGEVAASEKGTLVAGNPKTEADAMQNAKCKLQNAKGGAEVAGNPKSEARMTIEVRSTNDEGRSGREESPESRVQSPESRVADGGRNG